MPIQYACIHTQVDHPSLPSYIKHEDTAILSSSSHLKIAALFRAALTFNFNQSEGEWLAGFKIWENDIFMGILATPPKANPPREIRPY